MKADLIFILITLTISTAMFLYMTYDRYKYKKHLKASIQVAPKLKSVYFINGKKAGIKPITKSDVIEADVYEKIINEQDSFLRKLEEIKNPYIGDCEFDEQPIDKRFSKCWVLKSEIN